MEKEVRISIGNSSLVYMGNAVSGKQLKECTKLIDWKYDNEIDRTKIAPMKLEDDTLYRLNYIDYDFSGNNYEMEWEVCEN